MEVVDHSFLVESALLTHGISSISNEEMLETWPEYLNVIAWIDEGRIRIGGMAEFLPFRNKSKDVTRIDCNSFQKSLDNKISGALTASGTMELCSRHGIRLAVTCGMGGIGNVPGEELCPDLPALETIPVALISTSPKDMLDIDATIRWLSDHGVSVFGIGAEYCTGYLFKSARVKLDERLDDPDSTIVRERTLLLNPIPEYERIADLSILRKADEVGHQAAVQGAFYHPVANNEIDRLSGGHAARIQLRSIIANAELAKRLTKRA